jgi:Domain of unknown function (DUF4124)
MRSSTTFLLYGVLVLSQPAALAQGVIYKCLGAKGAMTYQNAPCPAGTVSREVKAYAEIPYDHGLAEKIRRDRVALDQRKQQTQSASAIVNHYGAPPSNPKVKRCRDAKAHREYVLDQVGLSRTYDLLQQLDREVYDACKDVPGV